MIYSKETAIDYINHLGKEHTPFVFFTDFLAQKAWIKPVSQINSGELKFQFPDQNNKEDKPIPDFTFRKNTISFQKFKAAYDQVLTELNLGNSYLINLTFKTPIESSLTLDQIFDHSKARYKIRYKNDFVVFSPETFIKIENGFIYSYPMKGTIDAAVPNAEQTILSDPKEMSEHVTIVDLIRNDLSQVATGVDVTKFRFISKVKTNEKTLLQVSSEIKGHLINETALGNTLFALLPAGSISGAPKNITVDIIQKVENYQRNYFTGICGYYDGKNLDSGVMIRFIENENGQLYFKSGGGITALSDAQKEYQEIIDKIYVPIH